METILDILKDTFGYLCIFSVFIGVFVFIGLFVGNKEYLSNNNPAIFPEKRQTPAHRINNDTPYKLIPHFLTVYETTFFRVLFPIACENNLYVFAKPRVADFVSVTRERYVKGSKWHTYFNVIAMKHIDFLLCDNDLKPIIGFEVDDSSHLRSDRIKRDEFLDKLYSAVGLKVVRVYELNDTDKIKQIVTDSILSPADVKEDSFGINIAVCPRCGQTLSEKVNSKSGEIFHGCNGFPKCRYTV